MGAGFWGDQDGAKEELDRSLKRLKTDYLDLVQIHMSPSRAEIAEAETVETLEELKSEGKLRFIGISGVLPDLRDHLEMGVFDAFQIPYSGLEREHEHVIAEAAAAGAGTIVRGGVARGAPVPERNPEDAPVFWRWRSEESRPRPAVRKSPPQMP